MIMHPAMWAADWNARQVRQQRVSQIARDLSYAISSRRGVLSYFWAFPCQSLYIYAMWDAPIFSRTRIAFILYFFSLAYGQSIPGASFLLGNGAPGAGQYHLVDDYEGSSGFFNKFNYYSVSGYLVRAW